MRVDTLSDGLNIALRNLWAFRRGTLWAAPLHKMQSYPVSIPRIPARFAQVNSASARQLIDTASQMDPISPEALKRRLKYGSRCYGTWVGESLVSYGWLTHGPEWVGEFERTLHIPSGDAYIWDCATLPKYRRLGLFRSLLGFIVTDALHEEIERLWIISVLNVPAIARGIRAAGFEPVVNLTYLRLLNVRGLLMRPSSDVPSTLFEAAKQVFTGENDVTYGPMVFGQLPETKPPETHF